MSAGLGHPVDSDALTELIDLGEHGDNGDNAGEFGDFKDLPLRSDLAFRLPLPLFETGLCCAGSLLSLQRESSFKSFSESDPISVSSSWLEFVVVLFEIFALDDFLDFFAFPKTGFSFSCRLCTS